MMSSDSTRHPSRFPPRLDKVPPAARSMPVEIQQGRRTCWVDPWLIAAKNDDGTPESVPPPKVLQTVNSTAERRRCGPAPPEQCCSAPSRCAVRHDPTVASSTARPQASNRRAAPRTNRLADGRRSSSCASAGAGGERLTATRWSAPHACRRSSWRLADAHGASGDVGLSDRTSTRAGPFRLRWGEGQPLRHRTLTPDGALDWCQAVSQPGPCRRSARLRFSVRPRSREDHPPAAAVGRRTGRQFAALTAASLFKGVFIPPTN